jgi:hypothetical protein
MADAAILVGWNEPKAGREAMAAQLYADAMKYYTTLVEQRAIESFEPVLLTRHGGDFNGFILLRGEAAKLDALQRSEEFEAMTIRGVLCLSGYGVIRAYIGEGLQRVMQRWMAALPR